ncbi:MAG: hypothetical protein R3B12_01045 [Candidatus Saccharimonadales bacterium]
MNPRIKGNGCTIRLCCPTSPNPQRSHGGSFTADQLAQLAPGATQTVNSANTALRINQTGAGSLQFQSQWQ